MKYVNQYIPTQKPGWLPTVICSHRREYNDIHDAKSPYWDHSSLNSINLSSVFSSADEGQLSRADGIISSADEGQLSGADGITDLSVVRRRPSVNFFFKSLLLPQFLFDHSEFFTGETRHIVPPYNNAGISNFCLEFQKLQKFQISSERYSSFSSYSIILNFLLEKLGI